MVDADVVTVPIVEIGWIGKEEAVVVREVVGPAEIGSGQIPVEHFLNRGVDPADGNHVVRKGGPRERIADRDRLRQGEELREVAAAHLFGRNVAPVEGRTGPPLAAPGEEEKRAVTQHRARDLPVHGMEQVLGLGGLEKVARGEGRVLVPVGGPPVELVGARLGSHDHRRGARVFGRVVAHHHLYFLHGVDVRGLQRAPLPWHAINGRLHLDVGLPGYLDSVDAARALHQRKRRHDDLRIPPVSDPWRVVEALAREGRLDHGGFGRDHRRVCLDRHFCVHRAEFESNVDAPDLISFEDDVGGDEILEARRACREPVGAAGKIGDLVIAVVVGDSRPRDVRAQVRDRNLRVGDHGAARIAD